MSDPKPSRITMLLNRLGQGEALAAEQLMPLVYEELKRLAFSHMNRPGREPMTLQPTALVHEAWLKFSDQEELVFRSRFEFFKLASRIMRSVLVDAARTRHAKKRGGDARRVSMDPALAPDVHRALDLIAVEEALLALEQRDSILVRVVELRFFAGLTNAEVAGVLGCTERTVERRWRLARAFLHGELDG